MLNDNKHAKYYLINILSQNHINKTNIEIYLSDKATKITINNFYIAISNKTF